MVNVTTTYKITAAHN